MEILISSLSEHLNKLILFLYTGKSFFSRKVEEFNFKIDLGKKLINFSGIDAGINIIQFNYFITSFLQFCPNTVRSIHHATYVGETTQVLVNMIGNPKRRWMVISLFYRLLIQNQF